MVRGAQAAHLGPAASDRPPSAHQMASPARPSSGIRNTPVLARGRGHGAFDGCRRSPAQRRRSVGVVAAQQLRIVVGEDQVLLREGMVRLLTDAGFDVVAQTGDALALVEAVRVHRPDVAIIDVQMPPDHTDDGVRAALAIRAAQPGTGVLVLSQFVEERYALDLVAGDAAGVGYLLKDRIADVGSFAQDVRRVAAGGSALDPEVVSRMLGRRRRDSRLDQLTPRERQVLELMAEGKSNPGIAEALGISATVVEKHAGNVFSKLGVGQERAEHRRVMAVLTHLRGS